jgi:hypothetical protein
MDDVYFDYPYDYIYCYSCPARFDPPCDNTIFSEKKEWKNAKGMVYCQAAELEEMYFTDPQLWKGLFHLSKFVSSMA